MENWVYPRGTHSGLASLTTDSKSIVVDPVVMGIEKSKAKELGLVGKDIYNKDLLEN